MAAASGAGKRKAGVGSQLSVASSRWVDPPPYPVAHPVNAINISLDGELVVLV